MGTSLSRRKSADSVSFSHQVTFVAALWVLPSSTLLHPLSSQTLDKRGQNRQGRGGYHLSMLPVDLGRQVLWGKFDLPGQDI